MSNNKNISIFLIGFLVAILAIAAYGLKHYAVNDKLFTHAAHKDKIESLIREYIVNNPEIIIEALKNLEVRKHDASTLSNMKNYRQALERNAEDPTYGNLDADITVVHFFDYNCGYCKSSTQALEKLLQAEHNVRLVYKEFPILGAKSDELAKVALAVHKIDSSKYHQFHTMLMETNKIDDNAIKSYIDKLELNYEDVKSLAASNAIYDSLESTKKLARDIQIAGTPTIIINGMLLNGPIDLQKLQEAIIHIKNNN